MDLKVGKSIIKKNIIMLNKLMKKTLNYLLLLLLIVSCTNYQTEYRDDAIREHKILYELENIF